MAIASSSDDAWRSSTLVRNQGGHMTGIGIPRACGTLFLGAPPTQEANRIYIIYYMRTKSINSIPPGRKNVASDVGNASHGTRQAGKPGI